MKDWGKYMGQDRAQSVLGEQECLAMATPREPKVSVIIPFFNTAKLERSISSVLTDSRDDLEVVLVDDGSSQQFLDSLPGDLFKDPRVRLIRQVNRGVSAARNRGLDAARGEFVCFLDADDWLESGALDHLVDIAEETNVDCVHFGYFLDQEDESIPGKAPEEDLVRLETVEDKQGYMLRLLSGDEPGYAVTWLVRRSALGDIRFDESVRIHEDLLFVLEILSSPVTAVISRSPLYHYDLSAPGASRDPARAVSVVKGALDGNAAILGRLWDLAQHDENAYRALLEARAETIQAFLVNQLVRSKLGPRDLFPLLSNFLEDENTKTAVSYLSTYRGPSWKWCVQSSERLTACLWLRARLKQLELKVWRLQQTAKERGLPRSQA